MRDVYLFETKDLSKFFELCFRQILEGNVPSYLRENTDLAGLISLLNTQQTATDLTGLYLSVDFSGGYSLDKKEDLFSYFGRNGFEEIFFYGCIDKAFIDYFQGKVK